MSGRPRNARGLTGRDGGKESDLEADLLGRVLDAIRKAKEYRDETERTGRAIMELEEEIKGGNRTPEQLRKLDLLYREHMRNSEAEKKIHDDEDIVSNIAILSAMKASDEPAPRNGTGKSRKNQKAILESDLVVDSPAPTPTEARGDVLKRVKGASQRSSSVASQNRASIAKEEAPEIKSPGLLQVGTEVFYKLQASDVDEGVGQHQIIKRVWQDKKITLYDLKDPEKGETSRKGIPARHLAVIPLPTQVTAPIFSVGSRIYARYPDTDTFYEAEVRNFSKGQYALLFEGEEETHKEHLVERRYVFDPTRWK
ncbi:uncharacterized protein HMPREF1541_11107 [Cyphellophora europaea CBS 101466]|uniref:SGF29 C-terminal domain-containing protein n=1 Tax=Cyphellophora europaea (strain CBS 101466) TaxID=1220924 RepID=W2S6W1_CYPE1|nr:uncharacterized protein HMPREF1541_11107 [Cyphellophora europaea CBS 101466]ETN43783.1 hypothetical protein HMPREF1541_11107 [Cyphellophora europaea CBS 101466]